MSSSSQSSSSLTAADSSSSSGVGDANVDPVKLTLSILHYSATRVAGSSPTAVREFAVACHEQLKASADYAPGSVPLYDVRESPLSDMRCGGLFATEAIRRGRVVGEFSARDAFALLPLLNVPCPASSEFDRRANRGDPVVGAMSQPAERRRAFLPSDLLTWESTRAELSQTAVTAYLDAHPVEPSDNAEPRGKNPRATLSELREATPVALLHKEQEARALIYQLADPALVYLLLRSAADPKAGVLALIRAYLGDRSYWTSLYQDASLQTAIVQLDEVECADFLQRARDFFALVQARLDKRRAREWADILNDPTLQKELHVFARVFRKTTLRLHVPAAHYAAVNELVVFHRVLTTLNHSCAANATLQVCADRILLLAATDIAAGDEITIDYLQTTPMAAPVGPDLYHVMGYHERARVLRETCDIYHCKCSLCEYDRVYRSDAMYRPIADDSIMLRAHTRAELSEVVKPARTRMSAEYDLFKQRFADLFQASESRRVPYVDRRLEAQQKWARAFEYYELAKPGKFDPTNYVHLLIAHVIVTHFASAAVSESTPEMQRTAYNITGFLVSQLNRVVGNVAESVQRDTPELFSAAWSFERRQAFARAAASFSLAVLPSTIDYWSFHYASELSNMAQQSASAATVKAFQTKSLRENYSLLALLLQNTPAHTMIPGVTECVFVITLFATLSCNAFLDVIGNAVNPTGTAAANKR